MLDPELLPQPIAWGIRHAAQPGIDGFALFALGLGIFAFTASLPSYLLATALVAAGGGILHPLLMALHVRAMPPARRGRAVSTFYLGFDLGNGMGVWVLGFALQWWGLTALFGLAMVTSVGGLLLVGRRGGRWTAQVTE